MRPRRFLAAIVSLAAAVVPALAACSETANISDVYLALDGEGARRRSVFFTDSKEIHCIAEGAFGRKDVTVEGYIRQVRLLNPLNDKVEEVDRYGNPSEFTPASNPGGQQTKLDISLIPLNAKGEPDDSAPFSAGSYKCEFLVDGKLEKSVDFNIDFPECPGGNIFPGDPCLGFYRKGKECPGGGARSTDKDECTCNGPEGWECQ